jgi:pimeloyl-ACP methyl ester carboxylesterase
MAEDDGGGEPRHLRLRLRGLLFHVVTAGPQGGPLVILLHGFPEYWRAWRALIGPLAAAGFCVVAPDQRGYNTSAKPPSLKAYALDELAADVVALADRFGAERFHVVGHDFGGLVGWWAALAYPDRIGRLVVLNSPHPIAARRYLRFHPMQAVRSAYMLLARLPRLPERALGWNRFWLLRNLLLWTSPRGLFGPDERRQYRRAWRRPGALAGMLNWYRALPLSPKRLDDAVVRRPALILWGDRDPFLQSGLAEASLEFCEKGRLRHVEGASHWLHHEGPELVAEEICAFLGAPAAGDLG